MLLGPFAINIAARRNLCRNSHCSQAKVDYSPIFLSLRASFGQVQLLSEWARFFLSPTAPPELSQFEKDAVRPPKIPTRRSSQTRHHTSSTLTRLLWIPCRNKAWIPSIGAAWRSPTLNPQPGDTAPTPTVCPSLGPSLASRGASGSQLAAAASLLQ